MSTNNAKKTARKATSSATTGVSSSTTSSSVPVSVPAPVAVTAPVTVPVSAPVVASTPVPVTSSVPASVPVASNVVVNETSVVEQVNITSEFTSLVEQLNTIRSTLSTVFSNMKKLEKQIPRELKKASKGGRRHRKTESGVDVPKKETVFTKPVPISDSLCTFLGVSKGTQLSRSEVTTRVCTYAKTNKLMDKQVIKADAALRKLLALKESDELKILNLQRYLKPHYTKPTTA